MLALQSYEQSNGFAVMTADELFYVNGGSSSFSGSGYFNSISSWGGEIHYDSDKRTVDAKIECEDGKINGYFKTTKK